MILDEKDLPSLERLLHNHRHLFYTQNHFYHRWNRNSCHTIHFHTNTCKFFFKPGNQFIFVTQIRSEFWPSLTKVWFYNKIFINFNWIYYNFIEFGQKSDQIYLSWYFLSFLCHFTDSSTSWVFYAHLKIWVLLGPFMSLFRYGYYLGLWCHITDKPTSWGFNTSFFFIWFSICICH